VGETAITDVRGRQVWDSRGRPTIEVEIHCGARVGRAIAPAGASTGSGEATDLRDGGGRLGGFGVKRAVDNVNRLIRPALRGLDATDQATVDGRLIELDATGDRSRLGGNAMIATSLATAWVAADTRPLWKHLAETNPVSLPRPEIQIIGGGAHAGRRIDIQDLMIVPLAASSFAEALECAAEVYLATGTLLADAGRLGGVADEGGWWPNFATNEDALATLTRAIERAGYTPGHDVAISLDIAASQFGKGGRYRLTRDSQELDTAGLCELLLTWIQRYPICALEDPLAEDDEAGMAALTRAVGDRVQIIGDDLLVTSADRISRAATAGTINAVLIKPNQAGTLTETRAAFDVTRRAGLATIISARSGESEDVSIVHLAVGWDAHQLKVGSVARGERTAKWNEAIRIEESLEGNSRLARWPTPDNRATQPRRKEQHGR
jgi:enolase